MHAAVIGRHHCAEANGQSSYQRSEYERRQARNDQNDQIAGQPRIRSLPDKCMPAP